MMKSKTRGRQFYTPLEISVLILFFVILNLSILTVFEERLLSSQEQSEPWKEREDEKDERGEKDQQEETKEGEKDEEEKETEGNAEQIITIEEDGRLGNLLMETATILLMGQKVNKTVHLLPQVAAKLSSYLSPLPLNPVDHTRHCVCQKCSDCLCPTCTKWRAVDPWTFLKYPKTNLKHPYVLIKWFHSDLVLKNLQQMRQVFSPLLRTEVVNMVQNYLHSLVRDREEKQPITWVGVHVRRTDYVQWIEQRYKGHSVDQRFFKHCMQTFRSQQPPGTSLVFLVTSDDLPWCEEHLAAEDVVFPRIGGPEDDQVVSDFFLLTQTNHTIYDYGSFGFWGAVLAGGDTMVADGYSDKIHPILAAIRKFPPMGWTRVDVSKLPGGVGDTGGDVGDEVGDDDTNVGSDNSRTTSEK